MEDSLKLALVHLAVEFGQTDRNRRRMIALNRQAAGQGAKIIVNTEAGISGYGFDSHSEMMAAAETTGGPTLTALGAIARDYQVYICVGLTELDPATDLIFNSAFLLGPDGQIKCRRRKITAEAKWACPGEPRQQDTCDTPWGRVGLLICSETYYGVFARQMALKGADLLLVPVNWPPGGLDLKELLRARAMENGVFLAACNRSGKDRRMDCSQASSYVFAPVGRALLADTSAESRIFGAELPLTKGRLSQEQRAERLSARRPGFYHYLCSDVRMSTDLTTLYDLPQAGEMGLSCLAVDGQETISPEDLEMLIAKMPEGGARLLVLPRLEGEGLEPDWLYRMAVKHNLAIYTVLPGKEKKDCHFLATPLELHSFDTGGGRSVAEEPHYVDYGTSRIGLATAQDLSHPELAMALAKRGCDLVAVAGGSGDQTCTPMLKVRAYEKLAVAAALGEEAFICLPPKGHQRFSNQASQGPGICSCVFDTAKTRQKAYPDRLDFELLLRKENGDD
jgi:predicted amidohydrolase